MELVLINSQGSVMMELPEIFKIVAFGDFNNFVTYADSHPNEVSTSLQSTLINLVLIIGSYLSQQSPTELICYSPLPELLLTLQQ